MTLFAYVPDAGNKRLIELADAHNRTRTVPLTSGLVAQIFGPRYMGTLFGIVFFSHQLGAFLGVWLGGYFFDTTGSYELVWWLSVALGVMAAVLHWPIDERPVWRVMEAT